MGWGGVLTWNIYILQGFSGNLITWLKVYVGFGLGEMHTSSPDSGIRMAIYVFYFYLSLRTLVIRHLYESQEFINLVASGAKLCKIEKQGCSKIVKRILL